MLQNYVKVTAELRQEKETCAKPATEVDRHVPEVLR
jgi:hypothetical protein